MTRVITITLKELRSYLVSPVAWVVATVFMTVSGIFFYGIVEDATSASWRIAQSPGMAGNINVTRIVFANLFQVLAVVLLFLVPIVTMRLLAEEKKAGTVQLLFTSPVRLAEIVVGKFVAALLLLCGILSLTLYMPLFVWAYASLDWGPILSAYLGLVLLTGSFVAIGLLASSLTENQIVAALLAFGALLVLWIIGRGTDMGGVLAAVADHISLVNRVESFTRGVVELKDVVYYVSSVAFCLFLTHRVLDSTRWR